jgi:Lon protease-like protein
LEAILTVPLFPLPRTVLFPSVRLPFFVFEPRYRRMLADALDGPGHIGIPHVLPGFECALSGSPPFNQVFGIGRIVDYTTHEDGTSHIEVVGTHRVRILEELPQDVYRTAKVTVMAEPETSEDLAGSLRDRLRDVVRGLLPLAVHPAVRAPIDSFLMEREHPIEAVVNTLATVLIADARTRQSLLEVDGIERRGRRLATELDDLRRALSSRQDDEPPPEPGRSTGVP